MKTIFITGGALGIGAAVARKFHKEGWSVGLLDINETALTALAGELGTRVWWRVLDVTDSNQVRAVMDAFVREHDGYLNVLFNCAGILRTGAFEKISPGQHKSIIDINVTGVINVSHAAFRPSGPARNDMVLNGITQDRLNSRRSLHRSLDTMRRNWDNTGMLSGLDQLNQQAFDILTSSRLADALDLSKEDPAVRLRYGKGDPRNYGDGAPRNLEHFLLARRLVEAGARVVTLNFGRWDFHSNNFSEAKNTHLPLLDQGLSALIEDLYERGLDKDVAVVAWGEFGRTPKINNDAGRDHWPSVGGGLIAGGGFRTGQVIGATDRLGGEIAERPIHFGEVHATLHHFLGLSPQTTLPDLSGRPQYLVDGHPKMPELL